MKIDAFPPFQLKSMWSDDLVAQRDALKDDPEKMVRKMIQDLVECERASKEFLNWFYDTYRSQLLERGVDSDVARFHSVAQAPDNEDAVVAQLVMYLTTPGGRRMVVPKSIPATEHDLLHRGYSFRYGVSDLVSFHSDGSVTIFEVKHSRAGMSWVMSGIGQLSRYAVQMDPGRALKKVRRCLVWSEFSSTADNEMVREGCEMANVVPFKVADPKRLMDVYLKSVKSELERSLDNFWREACGLSWSQEQELNREAVQALAGLISRCKEIDRHAP